MTCHNPTFKEATRERCAEIVCEDCGELLAYGDFAHMYRSEI